MKTNNDNSLVQNLITKLKDLRLPVFAKGLEDQLARINDFSEMSFLQRLTDLVDMEYDAQKDHRIERLIKNSNVPQTLARLEDIKYLPERHIPFDIIQILKTNKYIEQKLNVIILGETGVGKSFISSALTINACQDGYKSKFIRLQKLLRDLDTAKVLGTYQKMLDQYSKIPLLVIDDFLLTEADNTQQKDLLELMEGRCGVTSTIFCSQIHPNGWHNKLGGSILADSILDRIVPNAYKMKIDGDSMRICELPGQED